MRYIMHRIIEINTLLMKRISKLFVVTVAARESLIEYEYFVLLYSSRSAASAQYICVFI